MDQEPNRHDLVTEDFTAYETAQYKKRLPEIEDMLETHRRVKWLLKLLGAFLLAAPAVLAVGQGWSKFIEWIKGL